MQIKGAKTMVTGRAAGSARRSCASSHDEVPTWW